MRPEVDPRNSWRSLQQMSKSPCHSRGRLLGWTLPITTSVNNQLIWGPPVWFWLGILRGLWRAGCSRFNVGRARSPKSCNGSIRTPSVTENGAGLILKQLGTIPWLDQGDGQTARETGGAKDPDVILRRKARLGGGKKGREWGRENGYYWIPRPRFRNKFWWRGGKTTELDRHDLEKVIVGLKW